VVGSALSTVRIVRAKYVWWQEQFAAPMRAKKSYVD
jgi:hypothetical protein